VLCYSLVRGPVWLGVVACGVMMHGQTNLK